MTHYKSILNTSQDETPTDTVLLEAAHMEEDLARSALYDATFAVWFMAHASADVLANGSRAHHLFVECGEFAKTHRIPIGEAGDPIEDVLTNPSAILWYKGMEFGPLPGGRICKPTSWQIEKARKYLLRRHDRLLADHLAEADRLRSEGQDERAEQLAASARRRYVVFSDAAAPCKVALSDPDAIMSLAESNPPLFTLRGEAGRLLNARLKPDNLGVFLGDQKVGKTTLLVDLAVRAAKSVPTLFVSAGDETLLKIDGRVATNLTHNVTQREFAGTYGMPVPDCAHNANGTCPIGEGGEPRMVKDWRKLIAEGHDLVEMAEGAIEGARTLTGRVYQPCCKCFPMGDGDERNLRRNWRSAVWWRTHTFDTMTRQDLDAARLKFRMTSAEGGLRIAQYNANELGVEGLYELLDALDRVDNFVPEVIVLDYADIMKQEGGRATDKDHDGMRRIWEGLRGITTRLNLLLITATQTNREGDGIETHTRKTIGRSAKVADNCTWLVSLNQTVDERRAKLLRMSVMFAREGGFDMEHQALVCQWHEIQHSLGFSMPIFCKLKKETSQ